MSEKYSDIYQYTFFEDRLNADYHTNTTHKESIGVFLLFDGGGEFCGCFLL